MSITLYSFLLTFIAGFSTMIGTILIFFKEKTNRVVVASLSFASGVMLTVSILDLIPEAITLLNYKSIIEILIITVFMVLGALLTRKIDKCMPEVDNNSKKGLYRVGIISMFAIIMHNIPEGIATFMTTSTNLSLGLSLTIAIALHNIPEGISIAVPIFYSTGNRKKALFYTLVSAISEPFGALLAFLFLKPFMNNLVMGLLMAVIAGIMSYISFFELLPKSLSYKNKSLSYIFFVIGIIFMAINHFLF
jgi:ZIP family zinc transporter